MRKIIFYLVGMLAMVACGHGTTSYNKDSSNYKQQLWQKVGAEVDQDMQTSREPATSDNLVAQLKININDLRTKNKSFELYVFPKNSTMTKKSIEDDGEVYLTKPLVMKASTKYASNCAFLFKGGFKKLHPEAYFPAEYQNGKDKTCAILEITSDKIKTLSKSLVRDGDEIRKRIYFDDQYRVFGVETDYYSGEAGRVEEKTVGARYDGATHATSGLGLIPTDIPALATMNTSLPAAVNEVFVKDAAAAKFAGFSYNNSKTVVDLVSINQIKRLNKKYQVPSCSLKKLSYKDFYGRNIRSFWCKGAAWPQVVDAPSFLVVTQGMK